MALATMAREVARLRAELARRTAPESPLLRELRADPCRILSRAGLPPDPWQARLLRSSADRVLMLASRQVGKSLTSSALALREALLRSRGLVLLLSPSGRQSAELFADKLLPLYNALGRPVAGEETATTLRLENGSRVISLPGKEGTIRGYPGVRLLLVDEAARVPDALYYAVRPMLSVSKGKLVVLSTAYGRQGFFFKEFTEGAGWEKAKIPATQCPRISPEFLAEELRAMGPRWHAQEYGCEFLDAIDAVFDYESVTAALTAGGPPPLF
jgi:hypothetical protein